MSDGARMNIQAARQIFIEGERLLSAEAGEFLDIRQRRIRERERGRARHGAGHVRNAVVHHTIDDKRRLSMRRRSTRLEATALIDRDIDHIAVIDWSLCGPFMLAFLGRHLRPAT